MEDLLCSMKDFDLNYYYERGNKKIFKKKPSYNEIFNHDHDFVEDDIIHTNDFLIISMILFCHSYYLLRDIMDPFN